MVYIRNRIFRELQERKNAETFPEAPPVDKACDSIATSVLYLMSTSRKGRTIDNISSVVKKAARSVDGAAKLDQIATFLEEIESNTRKLRH